MILIYILVFIYCFLLILESIICKSSYFDYYFGVPGSGKTTFAAYIAKKRLKKKQKVYSNVNIKGCYKVEKEDIGMYDISNGDLLIDEAGIEFNNRDFMNKKVALTKEQIKWFKLHRHYKVNISVFSQSHEDTDATLRRLATRYYLLKKSIIPFFITRRTIKRTITIDKETHQIIDAYKFRWFGRKLIFSPGMWKMFNSYEAPKLPKKDFAIY